MSIFYTRRKPDFISFSAELFRARPFSLPVAAFSIVSQIRARSLWRVRRHGAPDSAAVEEAPRVNRRKKNAERSGLKVRWIQQDVFQFFARG